MRRCGDFNIMEHSTISFPQPDTTNNCDQRFIKTTKRKLSFDQSTSRDHTVLD
ncbi:MAG: hypothetical protein UT32_C0003G0021 [Parcubacteria group bacterium GW2011_GWC2_39_14]|nr:MAG: hypothetical protein UT32_C0003G0021 [Parcubacteria group bacterium GW2011_GWC2_39_14]KKR54970.1 MAG: hypothetical protein UT91_C0006G0021 [Parcubacteria group bacterium GW2011_GWA2_40_23]